MSNALIRTTPPNSVKSADRTLDVLELLASTGRPMTHTEISAALAIPKSSLSQLLRNLELRRYLDCRPETGRYVLGPAIKELARQAGAEADIARIAQPIVDRLARETRESSSCNILRDVAVERICRADSVQPLRYWMTLGETLPAHASSAAKAIIAFLPKEKQEMFVAGAKLARLTDHTIVSVAAFRRELAKVRLQGVAVSDEEVELGVVGISVPVLDRIQYPIASLTVVIPSVRATSRYRVQIIAALKASALSLSASLGNYN